MIQASYANIYSKGGTLPLHHGGGSDGVDGGRGEAGGDSGGISPPNLRSNFSISCNSLFLASPLGLHDIKTIYGRV
jgi:hypothetical protein